MQVELRFSCPLLLTHVDAKDRSNTKSSLKDISKKSQSWYMSQWTSAIVCGHWTVLDGMVAMKNFVQKIRIEALLPASHKFITAAHFICPTNCIIHTSGKRISIRATSLGPPLFKIFVMSML